MTKHVTNSMHVQAVAAAEAQRATRRGQCVAVQPPGTIVNEVSVSPDGKFFATCGSPLGHVAVWHTASSLLVRRLQAHPDDAGIGVPCHAWSPDGSQLATGDMVGTIVVRDVATGAIKLRL